VNLAALKIAALEKENLELKRQALIAQKESKRSEANKLVSEPSPILASPLQPKEPHSRDSPSFRAAFDKFEAFVLKPSEDRIPGMG
jgi:hypothetical protein